jgi:maltooligosyltrehalose trehalohydrolase
MLETNHLETKDQIFRRLPFGAEVIPEGGVHFRVWAPQREEIEVVLSGAQSQHQSGFARSFKLKREKNGYFSGIVPSAGDGTLYRYKLDDEDGLYPDPASRFQPDGPFGPSQVIDPGKFTWTDGNWKGISIDGQVLYEMHIGTLTSEGNWEASAQYLKELADTGITVIEIMPVAEFPGNFGWGYDGVDLFAPSHLYGRPDDFRQFVDKAHAFGIGVILDVVYNHLGPAGNYLKQYSESYFTRKYKNEWGEAINFDGPDSEPVREFFITNAGYWVSEFHIDGLRMDATQQIFDKSSEHILTAITHNVREKAGKKKVILTAENEPQHAKLVRPASEGGNGLDAIWNDDFHHSAMVALTGHNGAYYSEYLGNPQEFISCFKWGFLYQGQLYKWQRNRRGTPCYGLKPSTFILYLQNHDQIANSCCGVRMQHLTSPGLYRTMTALLLLAPGTPLLFQGQEFAASSPFFYFSDVSGALAENIRISRLKFLSQFRNLAQSEVQSGIPRPDAPTTFQSSKIDLDERFRHTEAYCLHRDLLKLRREDPVFCSQEAGHLDGAVIGLQAFVLRFFGIRGDDRLIIFNLGRDLHLDPAPEPLLAPPEATFWQVLWSSDSPKYGGIGTAPLETEDNWLIPGQAAVILKPKNQGII